MYSNICSEVTFAAAVSSPLYSQERADKANHIHFHTLLITLHVHDQPNRLQVWLKSMQASQERWAITCTFATGT